MSETPESETTPTHVVAATPAESGRPVAVADGRPSRLALIALWVAIVAGVVFTVAVIFFSGFALGKHSGGGGFHHGHGGWHHGRDHGMVYHKQGPPMGPMGPMGPWQQGPGFGPGFGPANPGGPGQPPTTSSTPHP